MNENTTKRFRSAYWALVHNMDLVRLRAWEDHHITLPQLRVLFSLRAQPGATTNLLVKLLGLTAPTVSSLIDKLTRAGLVERRQDPTDRRVIPLALTATGQEVVGEIAQQSQAYLTELAATLGEELEPLTEALERLGAAIQQHPALPAKIPSEVQA